MTKQMRITNRVKFLPAVPQKDLLEHTSSAEVGIIPYKPVSLNNYYTMPNKLFEYRQENDYTKPMTPVGYRGPNDGSFIVDTTAPITAPNVTVSDIDADGNVNMSWNAISGIMKYGVFRNTTNITGINEISRIANVTGTTFIDGFSKYSPCY